MKRITSALLAVLLGAIATGIGMGVFLKLANDDRGRLANEASQARSEALQALKDKQQIADEANRKVQAANSEVAKAQLILQTIEEERVLITTAKPLAKPPTRELRGWQATVSLAQGLSISLPPSTVVETNDIRTLTAIKATTTNDQTTDTRWLSISPFAATRERELTSSFSTSTGLSYLIGGRLLIGRTGVLGSTYDHVTVLRVQQSASSTHLIWIKDPGTLGNGNGLERLLGTLQFK